MQLISTVKPTQSLSKVSKLKSSAYDTFLEDRHDE